MEEKKRIVIIGGIGRHYRIMTEADFKDSAIVKEPKRDIQLNIKGFDGEGHQNREQRRRAMRRKGKR